MRKAIRLKSAITIALESASTISKELVKLTQDDYDDGIQTLGLHYSDGSVELVKREWPEVKYRNGDNTDDVHELILTSAVANSPQATWELITQLSREVPTDSMEGLFGPAKKPELKPKNLYAAYKKTYLDKSWLAKQKFHSEVKLSALVSAAVVRGKFELTNLALLKKLGDEVIFLGYNEAHSHAKNAYFEKLNEVATDELSDDVDKSAKNLRIKWRRTVEVLVPKLLPGGLKLENPFSDERFSRTTVTVPDKIPALTADSTIKYAELVMRLDDVVEALQNSIDQFQQNGIFYGWEHEDVSEENLDKLSTELKSEIGDLESVVRTIIDSVKDLMYLVDEYLHKSIV